MLTASVISAASEAATPLRRHGPFLQQTMDTKRIALCCLALAATFNGVAKANIPTVPEYFPEIQGDLSKVTWAHAVNSRSLLEEAMKGDVMMIEADIVLGTFLNGTGDLLPIMGHPPANTSDISLGQFIAFVEEGVKEGGKRKGVKLDFKTTEVFKASLPVLGEHKDKMNFPVMLNADILQGPIESKRTPVEADAFLYACRTIFPDATLSVGWTTLYGSDEGAENPDDVPEELTFYNSENVMDMMDALRRNSVNQTLTFPVRAGIAARSLRDLPALLEQQGSSFTLWSAKDDPVDVENLKKLIDIVGRKRVYIDVPDSLRKQLTSTARPLLGSVFLALLPVVASMALLR